MKNHFVNSVFLQEIFRFSLHFKTAAIPHSAPFSEKNTSEMSSRKRQIPLFALPGRLPIFVPYFLRHFDKIKYMRQFFEMVIRLHFSCQTRLSLSFFPAVFIIFEIDSPLFLISRFLLPTALLSFIRLCRSFCPQKRQRLSAARAPVRPEGSAVRLQNPLCCPADGSPGNERKKRARAKPMLFFSLQLFTGTYGSMRCLSVI